MIWIINYPEHKVSVPPNLQSQSIVAIIGNLLSMPNLQHIDLHHSDVWISPQPGQTYRFSLPAQYFSYPKTIDWWLSCAQNKLRLTKNYIENWIRFLKNQNIVFFYFRKVAIPVKVNLVCTCLHYIYFSWNALHGLGKF